MKNPKSYDSFLFILQRSLFGVFFYRFCRAATANNKEEQISVDLRRAPDGMANRESDQKIYSGGSEKVHEAQCRARTWYFKDLSAITAIVSRHKI